jgi:hypothetical protein
MSDWTIDLRSAARSFTAHPGFTTMVVATLALGIGATTVLFSLMYGILLRPFPYAEPERLVRLETVLGAEGTVRGASVQDLDDWRRSNRSLAGLAGYIGFDNILTADGDARRAGDGRAVGRRALAAAVRRRAPAGVRRIRCGPPWAGPLRGATAAASPARPDTSASTNILSADGDAQAVRMTFVSADLFAVLGAGPLLGVSSGLRTNRIGARPTGRC